MVINENTHQPCHELTESGKEAYKRYLGDGESVASEFVSICKILWSMVVCGLFSNDNSEESED